MSPPHPPATRPSYQEELLVKLLQASFGGLDDGTLAALRSQLEWVELRGGQTLLRQGEPGDAMYLVVAGRLRAQVRDEPSSAPRPVREIARGQVIGEMAPVSGAPRSATVRALRDSLLVRLPKRGFDELVRRSPEASMALMRQFVQRMHQSPSAAGSDRPVTIGLLAVSVGVDLPRFAAELAGELQRFGRVAVLDADAVDRELGEAGLAQAETGGDDVGDEVGNVHGNGHAEGAVHRVAMLLDRLEASHEFVLLVADAGPTVWSGRCCRHGDELLLVADARAPARVHASEARFLRLRPPAGAEEGAPVEAAPVSEVLVLLHPPDTPQPRGATAWLARRPVQAHVNLRRGLPRDMARLARRQSRQAVGLVLGGGGARGFAHLGLMQALAERGIEVDVVGGTSIGAAMASFLACDRPLAQVVEIVRPAFGANPTGDLNPFPVLSVFRGQRLKRRILETEAALFGGPTTIEDLWKGYFCVASNVTRACETVFERGPLATAVLASLSIPGALPPVLHEGDLLCDGGTFNNFPADVMRRMHGVGLVIGVDLRSERTQGTVLPGLQELPSAWALAWDRLRPRRRRRYRLPSITAYLMSVTTLYSQSRRAGAKGLCDVYINPPLERVGMLEWERFDVIVRQGHEHGLAVLDALPAELLMRLRGGGDASGDSATAVLNATAG